MKDRVKHIKAQYAVSHDMYESEYFKDSEYLHKEVDVRLTYMLADEINKCSHLYKTHQESDLDVITRMECVVLTVEDWRKVLEHLRRTNFELKIDKL